MALVFRLRDEIVEIVQAIAGNAVGEKIVLEPVKDPSLGDLATNAAMVCAKAANLPPKELALKIVEKLEKNALIAKASVAGPGFINLTLPEGALREELTRILANKGNYGSLTVGAGKTANVEYVSTNPTGPLHVGHGRNAILGDTIANLLEKAGFKVTREYYVNDAGGQTAALALSAHVRYEEALGRKITDADFDADMYKGDYLIPVGEALKRIHGDEYLLTGREFDTPPELEWIEIFRRFAIDAMLTLIKKDLASLGVTMDEYASESAIVAEGWVDKAINKLESSGDIHEGVLEKPKGHQTDDWEERPQILFDSEKYGDDANRALKKSDGSYTYFAGDVGYHYQKIKRKFDKIINVLGFDHVGYVKRLTAVVKALAPAQDYEIKTCQMVNFSDDGQPVRMSKRAGNFVTVGELIEKVGKDATRFMMVSRHQDMVIDFDFKKVLEQSKDNPLFYIQYAHARIHSVLRHAIQVFGRVMAPDNLDSINDEAELALIKHLIQWPRVVASAVTHLEPHRVANYLYDLASAFHSLWNKGKENAGLRFVEPNDPERTAAKLTLISAAANVIAEGLGVLGIEPLEEMR